MTPSSIDLVVQQDTPKKVLAVASIVAITLTLYALWARPYQQHWGATEAEAQATMPGDELDPEPDFLATRAIQIKGAPEDIWPWLMQMGFTRAGFYGFDLFEKVGSQRGPLGVDRILPQYQDFKVGDEIPVTPLESMTFHVIQPNEHMVWVSADGSASYTWALQRVDSYSTRLVVRTRWNYHWARPGRLPVDVLTEFSDHVAMRKVLEGIKGRVEGELIPRAELNVEMVLYFGALVIFLWALIAVARLPLTSASWLVGLAGGVAWLVTWYGPGSLWTGLSIALLVVWAIRLLYRERKRRRMLAAADEMSQRNRRI